MAKPRKTDLIPGAHDKVKLENYTLFRSSRSGEYHVYPDGRIFMPNLESLHYLMDRRRAAGELFELATQHVQKVEEDIAAALRRWWDDRRIDFKDSLEDWTVDLKTGELINKRTEFDDKAEE